MHKVPTKHVCYKPFGLASNIDYLSHYCKLFKTIHSLIYITENKC